MSMAVTAHACACACVTHPEGCCSSRISVLSLQSISVVTLCRPMMDTLRYTCTGHASEEVLGLKLMFAATRTTTCLVYGCNSWIASRRADEVCTVRVWQGLDSVDHDANSGLAVHVMFSLLALMAALFMAASDGQDHFSKYSQPRPTCSR